MPASGAAKGTGTAGGARGGTDTTHGVAGRHRDSAGRDRGRRGHARHGGRRHACVKCGEGHRNRGWCKRHRRRAWRC
jgi:hypothetical protein